MIDDRMRASFDEVAAWPLDRVCAALDLIDELDGAAAEARAEAEREARARASM